MTFLKTVYLDNAASSYPKPDSVYRTTAGYIRNNGANPGRSGHRLSAEAARTVFEARTVIGRYFSARPENVIFCCNTTHALNTAINGTVKDGSHVLISDMEHNSVWRPVCRLNRDGVIDFSVFDTGSDDGDAVNGFIAALRKNTSAAVITHASNVTGRILPLEEIYGICRERGILLITDAAQTAGLLDVPGDIVCAPGHKGLYGPQGTGVMIVRGETGLLPLMYGGTGTNSAEALPDPSYPEDYEAGTLNVPGIAGLAEGILFLEKHPPLECESMLMNSLAASLAELDGVRVYRDGCGYVPTVAFNVPGHTSENAVEILDREYGIALRGGLHCAPLCHVKLGTVNGGLIRASAGAFTTQSDIRKLIKAVRDII